MTLGSSYESFTELSNSEQEGISYQREFKKRRSGFAIIAPHGGGIEPGTSEIAKAIAGTKFSYYTFDGIRQEGNKQLHITSTFFDEPKCLQIVNDCEIVVTIHGCEGDEKFIYVGGLHNELRISLTAELAKAGFDARRIDAKFTGTQLQNICNRGRLGRGVQIEISEGLRRIMFKTFDRPGRRITTDVFQKFVMSIHYGLIAADV